MKKNDFLFMNFIQGWYVIYTKSRCEKKTVQKLTQKNFQVYLPIQKIVSKWSDRTKVIEKPLFNSYVFVYLKSMNDYFDALTIDGVVMFVKLENKLVRVLDKEIEKVRFFLNQFLEVESISSLELKVGDKKKINSGPFENYECEVIKINNKQKICVQINSLQQSLLAEIQSYHLI